MRRPLLLDLFCGAGGAAMGYHRAGFDVVGVDIAPQPRYPFEFHQADAMKVLTDWPADEWAEVTGFDAIHASPPCQAFVGLSNLRGQNVHADLLTPVRPLLQAVRLPWVIENVPGSPMRRDVVLCGSQFGLGVRRHRWFEFSSPPFALMPPCVHDKRPVGVYGHPRGGSLRDRPRKESTAEWREAMGIDWMTAAELANAIPPAYTEWIGAPLMDVVRAKETA